MVAGVRPKGALAYLFLLPSELGTIRLTSWRANKSQPSVYRWLIFHGSLASEAVLELNHNEQISQIGHLKSPNESRHVEMTLGKALARASSRASSLNRDC